MTSHSPTVPESLPVRSPNEATVPLRTGTEAGNAGHPGGRSRIRSAASPVKRGTEPSPRQIFRDDLLSPLTDGEAAASRRLHGNNRLTVRKRRSFLRQYLSNFRDPVIRILLGALGLNLLFSFRGGDRMECIGIALAVFLATLISTLSEYGSETAFARLSESCDSEPVRVLRRGGEADSGGSSVRVLPIGDLVVGDLVLLGAGDRIPADGVLLEGELQVDQSAMTGESREIGKIPVSRAANRENIPHDPEQGRFSPDFSDPSAVFRGCLIVSGSGEMRVTRVGDQTVLGEISGEVQEDTRESPLKIRLTKLAGQISRLGYVAAVLVAVVYLMNVFFFDSQGNHLALTVKLMNGRFVWEQLFHALTLGLTVLVVAVPEGLPMMIAVVLSSNIQKMVRDQVLVRKPVGIEAAGSMNILFTDKTGTLTEGKLSVGQIFSGDGQVFPGAGVLRTKNPELYRLFEQGCCVNSEATPSLLSDGIGTDASGGKAYAAGEDDNPPLWRAFGGNTTDRALLNAVLDAYGREKPSLPDIPADEKRPFDSIRKTAVTLARRKGKRVLFVKGAPERILPHIRNAYDGRGRRIRIDRTLLENRIRTLTEQGERVILLAENTEEGEGHAVPSVAEWERGQYGSLTLVCGVLLTDRLRDEAPDAVRTLKHAGIHVVMMTGDHRNTARNLAVQAGILDGTVNRVVDSEELNRMTDGQVRELLPTVGVISRALPADKSRLVRIAQEADLVVGMTGDGVNDSPALKRADIGFSMGSGTQVAKEAGDILIMDDNLSSIGRAVLYGRTIFKSIRKFITLQLTMNFCAVGVTMIGPFIGVDSPVTVVQMLWINLIMDTLGGLAFAGEVPLASYMKEKPKRRDEPILNRYMAGEIAWLGCFTIALCLFFLKCPWTTTRFRPASDHIYLLTAFFVLFIFASVFNCFNTRTDRLNLTAGLFANRAFCGIMTAVLIIQILFVYVGGPILRTAPLTVRELSFTLLLALTVFPAGLLRKAFRRLNGKTGGY